MTVAARAAAAAVANNLPEEMILFAIWMTRSRSDQAVIARPDDAAARRDSTAVTVFVVVVFALLASLTQVVAGEADVVRVKAAKTSDGTWRFDVTVHHDDAGWNHYADKWEVIGPDGTVFGERVLLHPHDNEQPFTRSQSGISIPDDIAEVTVRARDSEHAWGGAEMTVDLTAK
jgi:hypothetical protein